MSDRDRRRRKFGGGRQTVNRRCFREARFPSRALSHIRCIIRKGDPKYFAKENWDLPGGMQNRLHLLARCIVVPHPRGGTIDVTAPLPPHMVQSWNLLGFDATRYDPIVEAPEE